MESCSRDYAHSSGDVTTKRWSSKHGIIYEEVRKWQMCLFTREMFHYFFVRRLCVVFTQKIKKPSKYSQFTEEIGKAVMVTWYKRQNNLREIIINDFPKYICSKEAFMRYGEMRCIELFDDFQECPIKRLLLLTAFVLELGSYCFEYGYLDFATHASSLWLSIFYKLCFESFIGVGGWPTLYTACCDISKEYDDNGVEKDLGDGLRFFKLDFVIPKDDDIKYEVCVCSCNKLLWVAELYSCSRLVAAFSYFDLKTNKRKPPPEYLVKQTEKCKLKTERIKVSKAVKSKIQIAWSKGTFNRCLVTRRECRECREKKCKTNSEPDERISAKE